MNEEYSPKCEQYLNDFCLYSLVNYEYLKKEKSIT